MRWPGRLSTEQSSWGWEECGNQPRRSTEAEGSTGSGEPKETRSGQLSTQAKTGRPKMQSDPSIPTPRMSECTPTQASCKGAPPRIRALQLSASKRSACCRKKSPGKSEGQLGKALREKAPPGGLEGRRCSAGRRQQAALLRGTAKAEARKPRT